MTDDGKRCGVMDPKNRHACTLDQGHKDMHRDGGFMWKDSPAKKPPSSKPVPKKAPAKTPPSTQRKVKDAAATLTTVGDDDEDELDDSIRSDEERDFARKMREDREAHAAEVEAEEPPKPKKPHPAAFNCSCIGDRHMMGEDGCKFEKDGSTRRAQPARPPTAMVRAEDQPTMLSVERAREFLAKSKSVDEVREVADKAKAVALYLRSRDASIESQNDAAEIRLRAERRIGELTRQIEEDGRGRPEKAAKVAANTKEKAAKSAVISKGAKLAELGLKERDARRYEQLAKIPEKKFEALVTETKAKGERLTANAPLKMVRQETKAQMAAELRAKPIPQVTGRFDVIVIDPPWKYDKRDEDITQRGQGDYPRMELDAIKALPVAERAEDNCILWCWVTNGFMRQAYECLDAWGFQEKTILTWGKDRMGNGDWLRGKTEHCIMAVKGSPIVTLTNQTTLLVAAVREHSRKPDEFYALVEKLCPGTKLEMFAQEARPGYVPWGAQPDKFSTEAA